MVNFDFFAEDEPKLPSSEPKTFEVTFDNHWKVVFTPENPMKEYNYYYNVDFHAYHKNGNNWETAIRGQIKHSGCSDWGYGEEVCLHMCDAKDCQIFAWIYEKAKEVGGW